MFERLLFAVGLRQQDEVEQGELVPSNVLDYVKYVERAASDVAARRERERVLDEVLAQIFEITPTPSTV
jgi:hypothetical protein